MWKNAAERADDCMAHEHCMRITIATHTLTVYYNYSFPTATMVARTFLDLGNMSIASLLFLIGRGKSKIICDFLSA